MTTANVKPGLWERGRRRLRHELSRGDRCLSQWGLPLSENSRRLARLRNRHYGQRGFVIGNGPSLSIADLDALQCEITFASNKVFLAFDQTTWRPTYYSVTDILVARNNRHTIRELSLCKLFGWTVRNEFAGDADITWIHERPAHEQGFSADLFHGAYGGYSVVFTQLQLAAFLGLREIILLGIDFHFDVPQQTHGACIHGEVLKGSGETNHFHPDYRKPGETWTMPRLDMQRAAFQRAADYAQRHGIQIWNASRQTRLDVFPCRSLDTWFGHRERKSA